VSVSMMTQKVLCLYLQDIFEKDIFETLDLTNNGKMNDLCRRVCTCNRFSGDILHTLVREISSAVGSALAGVGSHAGCKG